jgi:myb proto-oncogene protein
MGRAPCCDKNKVKRGPWSPDEDHTLKNYLHLNAAPANWIALPHKAGLKRCGKSCRLRWLNYLRPNINHGAFSQEEDNIICTLFSQMGSRWSIIASKLQGRTDNDVKNHWNTKLKKKFMLTLTNPIENTDISKVSHLVPKFEAYNPVLPPFATQYSPTIPSLINYNGSSSSSSIIVDHNYNLSSNWNEADGYSIDFGNGFFESFMSGFEGARDANCNGYLGDSPVEDSKPGFVVMSQNVANYEY